MNAFLPYFAQRFAQLDANNLHALGELYSADVLFQDPLHTLHGLSALQAYCQTLYSRISQLRWQFDDYLHGKGDDSNGDGVIRWQMTFCHPQLRGGQPICVEGCSFLRWEGGKVCQQRDYFDAGQLLYEHVPLLGRVIAYLKARLA